LFLIPDLSYNFFAELVERSSAKWNKFDFFISNPPYIPTKDMDSLQREVIGYCTFIWLCIILSAGKFWTTVSSRDSIITVLVLRVTALVLVLVSNVVSWTRVSRDGYPDSCDLIMRSYNCVPSYVILSIN